MLGRVARRRPRRIYACSAQTIVARARSPTRAKAASPTGRLSAGETGTAPHRKTHRARPFSTVASSSGGQLGERARCEHLSPNVQINVAFIGVCASGRSEEHTSELQSHSDLVCRLLLEKKKNQLNSV